jgi:hypothetical protein
MRPNEVTSALVVKSEEFLTKNYISILFNKSTAKQCTPRALLSGRLPTLLSLLSPLLLATSSLLTKRTLP